MPVGEEGQGQARRTSRPPYPSRGVNIEGWPEAVSMLRCDRRSHPASGSPTIFLVVEYGGSGLQDRQVDGEPDHHHRARLGVDVARSELGRHPRSQVLLVPPPTGAEPTNGMSISWHLARTALMTSSASSQGVPALTGPPPLILPHGMSTGSRWCAVPHRRGPSAPRPRARWRNRTPARSLSVDRCAPSWGSPPCPFGGPNG